MKIHELERLSPWSRRRFLKLMSAAMAGPCISEAAKLACAEIAGGKAYAQSVESIPESIFIEINYRDQWDFGHCFVSPGIATSPDLERGERGRDCAMFFRTDELTRRTVGASGRFPSTEVYLTPQSTPLEPHLDSIAMMDLGVLTFGSIHGHESLNPLRSPGRLYQNRDGYLAVHNNDETTKFPGGNEAFWSRTPTPASYHNYLQKLTDPSLVNGVAFKGISRDIHTVYHFGAGIPGAELTRTQSRDQLFRAFPSSVEDLNILSSAEEAEALAAILERVDRRALRTRATASGLDRHLNSVQAAQRLLYSGQSRTVSLPLTEEEEAYWGADVPGQRGSSIKGQIWEQVAWAFKAVSTGLTRTVALEFDYVDIHDERSEDQMRVMTAQTVLPLRRLIDQLQMAGLYERTTIAMYTLDGGRAPYAYSSGDQGKNTLILAGGRVRGGYFGDIRRANESRQAFTYHRPDESGAPVADGVRGNDRRVDAAQVYRTTLEATGLGQNHFEALEDVRSANNLPYMLR